MRHPPVLVKDGRPAKPLTLDPRILATVKKLGEWAVLIAIPSNTPHLFLDELTSAAGCEIVSMADVTLGEVERRGTRPIGLIGLGVPQIYVERFEERSIPYVTAPEELRERLDTAIQRLMEGRNGPSETRTAVAAVDAVRAAGATVTVMAAQRSRCCSGTRPTGTT